MHAVAVQVQFSQLIVGTGVVEDTHSAHLVSHYQLIRPQTSQSSDLVFTAV